MNIKLEKFLVIYNYYEIKNCQKNQTNLSFFIRYGLCNNNCIKLNIDYLFIVNDICEVLIPNLNNIEILKLKDYHYDFESWRIGIDYIEKKIIYRFMKNIAIYFL